MTIGTLISYDKGMKMKNVSPNILCNKSTSKI